MWHPQASWLPDDGNGDAGAGSKMYFSEILECLTGHSGLGGLYSEADNMVTAVATGQVTGEAATAKLEHLLDTRHAIICRARFVY